MNTTLRRTLASAAVGGTALLALVTPGSAQAATPAVATAAHVTAATSYVDCNEYWSTTVVKVRTGPGTGYTAIGQLGTHNIVDWVNENSNNSWTKVRLLQKSSYGLAKGTVGWVYTGYLAYHSPCYTSINV
ncbi:SH3 domain-containing protein [Streptacidiphilus sp. EB103A]|uniref:SH3 domain-containing protein n=1 Tax=Streptacidiphilus sp. EB103A TaxID=3156275 RepID=UPI003517AF16